MRDWRDGCGVSIGTGQTGGNLDGFLCEKSSKMTDLACLGRSTELLERNLVEISGFCI